MRDPHGSVRPQTRSVTVGRIPFNVKEPARLEWDVSKRVFFSACLVPPSWSASLIYVALARTAFPLCSIGIMWIRIWHSVCNELENARVVLTIQACFPEFDLWLLIAVTKLTVGNEVNLRSPTQPLQYSALFCWILIISGMCRQILA
jgi:hypothetical protein